MIFLRPIARIRIIFLLLKPLLKNFLISESVFPLSEVSESRTGDFRLIRFNTEEDSVYTNLHISLISQAISELFSNNTDFSIQNKKNGNRRKKKEKKIRGFDFSIRFFSMQHGFFFLQQIN